MLAMIRTLALAGALIGFGFSTAQAQAAPPLRLDLNIPALELIVYEGDAPIVTYRVAVGMPGHDTPDGEFVISHAEWNPWWRPPTHRPWARNEKVTPPGPRNPMGRVKLFFDDMYFIHGTPDAESIGSPASHGCVRMRNTDVIALSRLLHERAAAHVSKGEIDRILSRPSDTRRVNFRQEIPLTVRYHPVVVKNGEVKVYPDLYNRKAIHNDSVYQALVVAGYDVSGVDAADVRKLVERGRATKAPFTLGVADAFGAGVAQTLAASAP
jgi:hypothetical protein